MKSPQDWESIFLASSRLNFTEWARMVQTDALAEAEPLASELRRLRDIVSEADVECIDTALAHWERRGK